MSSIHEKTRRILNEMKRYDLKHFQYIDDGEDRILAKVEIRGEAVDLLDYDYYLLWAVLLTDDLENVDYLYVASLRLAIREDINHGYNFLDILDSANIENAKIGKAATDALIEIYNEYWQICSSDDYNDDTLLKWQERAVAKMEGVAK